MSSIYQVKASHLDRIKADARNWLAFYSGAPFDRLPPEDALAHALALESLAAEIRRCTAESIVSFELIV